MWTCIWCESEISVFFDKDYVRLGKGKIEEILCRCLVNLDLQTQKEAGSSTKVTGRRRGGRETWLWEDVT